MNNDVNKIYGILVDGAQEKGPYYRYTTVNRQHLPVNRLIYLNRLIPTTANSLQKKATAEFCIRLLQSSEQWSSLLEEFDPCNTYAYETQEPDEPVSIPSFREFVEWASVCPFGTADTVQLAGDTDVDRIIKALCATVRYE